tara:strand:- start:5144 stop:6292 length:1149 start_codon:yes stop_codon:yes gene_type:complete
MSKLMEAALEVMNQQMVKEAKKFDSKAIEKAIEIALSMGGNMTGASKKIEKIAKGLSGDQKVQDALRLANESVVTEAKNKFQSQVVDIVSDLQDRVVDDLMDRIEDLDPSDSALRTIDKAISKETKKAVSNIMKTLDNAKLTESVVTEAKVTVNVDWMGDVRDPDTSKVLKKYKIKAKEKGKTADLTGDKKDVAKYLQAVHHAGEYKTVQDLIDDGLYSELEESVVTEAIKKVPTGLKKDVGIAQFSGDKRGIKDAISYAAKNSKMKKSDFIIFQGPYIGRDGTAYPETMKTQVVDVKDADVVKALTKAGAEKISQFSGGQENKESVEVAEAQSGGKEAYAKFFKATLKKFDVKSVAELDDEKKKEFFNYVDKEWEGTNEDD